MEMKIFCNEEWERFSASGQIVLCGYYHRYWNPGRTKNQASLEACKQILLANGARRVAMLALGQSV